MSADTLKAGDRVGIAVYKVHGQFGTVKEAVKVFVGRAAQKRAAKYAEWYAKKYQCGTVLGSMKVNDD